MHRSILLVKHIDFETGGQAATFTSHLPTTEVVFPRTVPELDSVAGIVVFGGTMSAVDTEQYPSLELTTALVRDAVRQDIPVLGLCLGHQILGVALGAEHRRGTANEVGLTPVSVLKGDPWLGGFEGTLRPMQWHGDEVSLPPGADLLATNDTTEVQAFRYGSALGLQFHLEVDDRVLRLWDTFESPPLREVLPHGDVAELRAEFAADDTLADVAERGFTAFADACRERL